MDERECNECGETINEQIECPECGGDVCPHCDSCQDCGGEFDG